MTILKGFTTSLLILGLFASVTGRSEPAAQSQSSSLGVVQEVKVTLLSTNLADVPGVGEWGLSALVEVDGRCILFDAGRYPDTVLRNARELDVDLSCVTDVVLSHHHGDHNGGLITLQEEFRKGNPTAFQRACGPGNIPLPPCTGRWRAEPDDRDSGEAGGLGDQIYRVC